MGGFLDGLTAQQPRDRMYSIATGIVKENWNQDCPGSVKVEMFMGEQGKNVTGWLPVAAPYAGKEHGMYFLPEIGSEVVIAFNMGDRNCPIVIGSLWNHVNTLPGETAVEKNTVKRLKTKGGCQIVFDGEEKKERINISTPAGLSIRMEDEAKVIIVADSDGKNKVVLDCDKGGITVAADQKIEFLAGGKVMLCLDGGAKAVRIDGDNIKVNAGQGLELKGQSLKAEGASAQIKGQSALKLESGAVAEVKGTMVKIN